MPQWGQPLKGQTMKDYKKPESDRYWATIELLWDSLKTVKGHPERRQTGWGNKTKQGLVACIDELSRKANQ